ncbi:HesA/MoeB/ThiF family protein [Celerinatantimonas diazotrophica]|uniref:Sulfur carrier protein ThiS adenylyltransferase/adenylyltransferase/sulfurtransferase n=1 Tax=Celerinatantimonas diazotrophica TaxID=412034 RepID=A0A4R1J7W9_9GAMM|nr:HesA/MoeB/ThiF family protein [Celerinatantimonas diazotrophica]TCK46643.1 sulfur carrier protein ThiS adenylyltransferase/adenylyltransferase/sulfurtransferase [Celerinatantimonas diazotrophica]CAG9295345.1 Molybdopterin-synthase adenylyltransferase [Celerinatantimonas diazotrophica]
MGDSQLTDAQLKRYSRHLLLAQVGEAGQLKLANASVLIVGMGGLGAPAGLYLAGAGVGKLVLADDDIVSESNLQRQIVYSEKQLGQSKVNAARDRLQALNHDIHIRPVQRRLSEQILQMEVMQADVVLDCSDNIQTRYALSDTCQKLKVPLVSGAAVAFDGQLMVFDFRQPDSPCYRCLFPQASDAVLNCSTAGVLGPLVGVIGSLQALECIKMICQIESAAVGRFSSFDGLSGEWFHLQMQKRPNCQCSQ